MHQVSKKESVDLMLLWMLDTTERLNYTPPTIISGDHLVNPFFLLKFSSII